MKNHSFRRNILLLSSIILVLTIGLVTPQVFAAEGDVLSVLDCAGDGVGIGFDGTTLYWLDFIGDTLHRCDTAGSPLADIPISGCTATVISWDSTRGMFWGASSTSISLIDSATGNCTPQFTITDTPGNCDNGFGCSSLIDGIAYDGTSDTVWWSPDGSQRAYQYDTADGSLVSFFDVNDPPDDQIAECGFNYQSGLAAGSTDVMWVGANGCTEIFKFTKTGTKLTSINLGLGRTEDLECDSVTFPGVDAIWTKDAFDTELTAFEVADGTCTLGGGIPETPVGGSIIPIDTTSLLIAGAFTNGIWIAPVLAGVVGTVTFYLKKRKN
ncbi:MAG: hypothetical protein ACRD94_08045 [Nitrosopumilaceae archaeon]